MRAHPLFTGKGLSHVDNEQIMAGLEAIADEAVAFLSPYFEVQAQPPFTVLGSSSAFEYTQHPGFVSLYFRQLARPRVIGEEFDHYLHFVKKPGLFDQYGTNLTAANFLEMVGYYSGLVYASAPHPLLPEVSQRVTKEVQPMLHSASVWSIENFSDREGRSHSARTHYGGVRAAVFFYQRYGPNFLKELSRMELQDSPTLFEGAGYRKQLVVKRLPAPTINALLSFEPAMQQPI